MTFQDCFIAVQWTTEKGVTVAWGIENSHYYNIDVMQGIRYINNYHKNAKSSIEFPMVPKMATVNT